MSDTTTTSCTRLHAIVRGRVQGVGFRNWVYSQAKLLRVMGWVANTDDGGVAVLADGGETVLQELLAELHKGPRLAKVTGVEVTWSTSVVGEFSEFLIRKK